MMSPAQYIHLFQHARKDSDLAVIEGVQALKHAVRFGAEIEHIITCDISTLKKLVNELAPDISQMISAKVLEVDEETFSKISPKNHRTKVVSLAKRRQYSIEDIDSSKPIVFLENPKDLENIGAAVRVAAAADAGAVVTDAQASVWHPAVIRGAAGLQYALPVMNKPLDLIVTKRTIVALDPSGAIFSPNSISKNAVLIFGTERSGITKEALKKSGKVLSLPMKDGVSSLNLATSIAATLYQLPRV